MYFDNISVRSSLLLIGIVVVLAGAVGFVLPMLSSSPPAGASAVVEDWSPPAPTATAQSRQTALASPSAPLSANSGSKVAFIALDTATPAVVARATRLPSPQLSPPQPARMQADADEVVADSPPALVAAPAVIEVPDWEMKKGVQTAPDAGVALFATVSANRPVSLAAPVPPVRVPDAALGVVSAAPGQTREAADLLTATAAGPLASAVQIRATVPPTQTSKPAAQTLPSREVAPPQLVNPQADARLSGMVTFEWSPVVDLARGLDYEIVVWTPGQDPGQARGIAPATVQTSQQVNLNPLFASGQFQSGNLYWTVLVVQRDPYLRLTAPGAGEARYLVLSNSG